MCSKQNKRKSNQTLDGNITYINMPISSIEEDKIGIVQYAEELKNVIDKGAESIAVTSDFGGGKSSLIRYLESMYKGPWTKFCYVNLWSEFKRNSGTENLHKSFIYQLANQISLSKGNYVSKRLSENYGFFTIVLPNVWAMVLSFLMFLSVILGFACTNFYKIVSKCIDVKIYEDYHTEIGILAFVIAISIALFLIYKSDVVFSSKKATEDRKVDEHELIDIYRTYISKRHLRHYIVVIEDLDRSNNANVTQFIREFRRYYVPYRPQKRKRICKNRNRITFIVNIKTETDIVKQNGMDLYAKAFDYILDLKEIHIDNYDVILAKLLKDKQSLFDEQEISVFNADGEMQPEFEWIIRGKRLDIREIKTRLNAAISTYVNLCSKFDKRRISLKKCIAAAYITNAYKTDYAKVKEIGFDVVIDLYVSNHKMKEEDIVKAFQSKKASVVISNDFASNLRVLIHNGMIASDYRQYFYNFPQDSSLSGEKQQRLIDIILYDRDVSTDEEFGNLVKEVLEEDISIVTDAFDRLDRLRLFYPECIFYNEKLFDIALRYNEEMLWQTIEGALSYDVESISHTSRLLIRVIKSNFIHNQKYIDLLCEVVVRKAKSHAMISFRRSLIEEFGQQILLFKELFFKECPLITKTEVDSLKNNLAMLQLINMESQELNVELIDTVHSSILGGLDLSNEEVWNQVVSYYQTLYEVLGVTESAKLMQYVYEIMKTAGILDSRLESMMVYHSSQSEVLEQYVDLICGIADMETLPKQTLQHIEKLEISQHLSPTVCEQLKKSGYYDSYVINACNTDIRMIDFAESEIVQTINSDSFREKLYEAGLLELVYDIRDRLLKTASNLAVNTYQSLFVSPYSILQQRELSIISNVSVAVQLLDAKQIDSENMAYIVNYFNKELRSVSDSNAICGFVCDKMDSAIKREFFLKLNFDLIQYYRMTAKQKAYITNGMSDVFDFNNLGEQILFMKTTKCGYTPFEKEIKKAISDNKFKDFEEEYVEFIKISKKITKDMIDNYCSLRTLYAMPEHVQEKLYSMKKYKYYVASKNLENKQFVFETERLDKLATAYREIFLSGVGAFKNSKEYMSNNSEFVAYMCNQKLYEGTPEHSRLLFVNCRQSEECLRNLVDKYSNDFCIDYLSKIRGFLNEDAEWFFVESMEEKPVIAASEQVYNNTYNMLSSRGLKAKLTKYHKWAKEDE